MLVVAVADANVHLDRARARLDAFPRIDDEKRRAITNEGESRRRRPRRRRVVVVRLLAPFFPRFFRDSSSQNHRAFRALDRRVRVVGPHRGGVTDRIARAFERARGLRVVGQSMTTNR